MGGFYNRASEEASDRLLASSTSSLRPQLVDALVGNVVKVLRPLGLTIPVSVVEPGITTDCEDSCPRLFKVPRSVC